MAKCVQIVGQGIPVRLNDEDAFQIVERDKDGQYCSKRFWKDWCDNHGHSREHSRIDKRDRHGRIVWAA